MNNSLFRLFTEGFTSFFIFLLFSVGLFFIIREIALWYFRINKNTESLDRIANSLEKIAVAADFLAIDIDSKGINKEVEKKVGVESKNSEEAASFSEKIL